MRKEDVKIVDVVKHKASQGVEIVTNLAPAFLHTQIGGSMLAEQPPFYDMLRISHEYDKAFAGRPYPINMSDGTQYVGRGELWWGETYESRILFPPLVSVGWGTREILTKSYGFRIMWIDHDWLMEQLRDWQEPVHEYWEYDRILKEAKTHTAA